MAESKRETIERVAVALGKTRQDLANWRFKGKVPDTMQVVFVCYHFLFPFHYLKNK